jgi:hypothetical protein
VSELALRRNSRGGINRESFVEVRGALIQRDGSICAYCRVPLGKGTGNNTTLDHRVPRSAGGSDDIDNLVLACRPCNTLKGSQEWPLGVKVQTHLHYQRFDEHPSHHEARPNTVSPVNVVLLVLVGASLGYICWLCIRLYAKAKGEQRRQIEYVNRQDRPSS